MQIWTKWTQSMLISQCTPCTVAISKLCNNWNVITSMLTFELKYFQNTQYWIKLIASDSESNHEIQWMVRSHKCNCSRATTELVNWGMVGVFLWWWMRVDMRVTGHYLASSSMRSCLLMPSGISLGMAATHVRNRSIFGLRSPLQQNTNI